MSRRRNLPLTEAQQRRFPPATIGAIIVVKRRLGPADALAWVEAATCGSVLAPDGTTRDLRQGEAPYIPGVLLTPDHREQLRRMEIRVDRETGERRPLTERAYQARVSRWIGEGFAHRCTRNGPVTLILSPRYLPGDPCPWAECPAADSVSARMVRSERTDDAPRAHESFAHDRGADSTEANPSHDLRERPYAERTDDALATGVQRGENGVHPPGLSPEEVEAIQQAQEALT
jgi:hypothetical protein